MLPLLGLRRLARRGRRGAVLRLRLWLGWLAPLLLGLHRLLGLVGGRRGLCLVLRLGLRRRRLIGRLHRSGRGLGLLGLCLRYRRRGRHRLLGLGACHLRLGRVAGRLRRGLLVDRLGGRRRGRRHGDLRLGADVAHLVLEPGGGLHRGVHLLVDVHPQRITFFVRPEEPGLLLGVEADLDGGGTGGRRAGGGRLGAHRLDGYLGLLDIALRKLPACGGRELYNMTARRGIVAQDLPALGGDVFLELLGNDGVLLGPLRDGRRRRLLGRRRLVLLRGRLLVLLGGRLLVLGRRLVLLRLWLRLRILLLRILLVPLGRWLCSRLLLRIHFASPLRYRRTATKS